MRKFTQSGRVVYNRKKHLWTTKDLMRIGKSFGATFFYISERSWEGVIADVQEVLFAKPTEDFDFGGGEFGGGGATRSVARVASPGPSPYRRVIIIVETVY